MVAGSIPAGRALTRHYVQIHALAIMLVTRSSSRRTTQSEAGLLGWNAQTGCPLHAASRWADPDDTTDHAQLAGGIPNFPTVVAVTSFQPVLFPSPRVTGAAVEAARRR